MTKSDNGSNSFDRRAFLRYAGLSGGALGAGALLAACGSASTPAAAGSSSASSAALPGSSSAAAPSSAAVAGTAPASSSSSASAGAAVGAGKTIGISLNGNNAYSGYVVEGVLKAIEGTGYKFKGVQNDFDSSKELGNIQSLLSQGINGLVVLPTDANTIAKAAQLAQQKGIAFGNALWPGKTNADQYYTGVADLDSVAGGRLIGEWLKKNAKPGPVIVVQGILGQGFSEEIDQGLDAALAGTGFSVVVREQGFFARDKATTIVQSGLQAHPGTTAIVAYSASMSDGIAAYLKSKNISTISHVSSDGDDEMFTWLKTPYLAACRYYSAAQTGLLCAQAVMAKLEGKAPIFSNVIAQEMITGATAAAAIAKTPYRYQQFAAQAATI